MTTWTETPKASGGTAEVDFLFSDGLDFLFSDSSDYVFVEGSGSIVWTHATANSSSWSSPNKS
jgi:hypothetical protein